MNYKHNINKRPRNLELIMKKILKNSKYTINISYYKEKLFTTSRDIRKKALRLNKSVKNNTIEERG